MCGISGIWWKRGASAGSMVQLLRSMTSAVSHRGPDDEGYLFVKSATRDCLHFCGNDSPAAIKQEVLPFEQAEPLIGELSPNIALGHRRFAIISPTPEGHQPFWDRTRRAVVVFNGEIYNYIEVRRELEALGRSFQTTTDTEVLVEAYLEWGVECFSRLNGMWAIALYDFERRELILCRDRVGERPLYWLRRPEGIYFASEIKALLASGLVADPKVCDQAAVQFLYQALSDVDEKTFVAGIESLPIATAVRIGEDGRIEKHRYWQMPESRREAGTGENVEDLCVELQELLRESVMLRLRADVPVNVALSGGMDSSSVVAMAASLRGEGLATYTVRYREREWNEWEYARAVADRYRVNNFVIDPPNEWIWNYFDVFVRAMEEPFHGPDLLPDHVVRRMLAARGIRVSLSGIGGDELFAGYDHYRQCLILDLKREGKRFSAWREVVRSSQTTRVNGVWSLVQSRLRKTLVPERLRERNEFWERAFVDAQPRLRPVPQSCGARLKSDIEWSLLPYWLRAGDKSSMAVPIEVRYPLLDHRLIEFASRLPIEYLIRDGWTKWILRRAMTPFLPQEVIWRRKKMGFPFPIAEWLEREAENVQKVFVEMDNAYLDRAFWLANLGELIRMDPWLVWRALSFELWHRHFIRKISLLPLSIAERPEDAVSERAVYA